MNKTISFVVASLIILGSAQGFAAKTKTLFDRLGEKAGIATVVKDFVENHVAKDKTINGRFAHTDISNLEAKLTEQICFITTSNKAEYEKPVCEYTGKDMKTAHAAMNVSEKEFGALVGDLVKTLEHHKVAKADIAAITKALGGEHDNIVTTKTTN